MARTIIERNPLAKVQPRMTQPPKESIDDLLRHIDLRPTDYDRFRGDVEQEEGRLFGGLVLAQAVVAAGRTVEKGDIHSLHAYFLRAGQPVEPIDYVVERIREGRNFFTRRVTALQETEGRSNPGFRDYTLLDKAELKGSPCTCYIHAFCDPREERVSHIKVGYGLATCGR